jgi:hypothetical protein
LRQAFIRADPQVAVLGLSDGANGVLRKTMFLGPDGSRVLRKRALGIQRKRRPDQRTKRRYSEQSLWQHF